MRIISKFRDFYDIGMHYGQDEDLIWVRETEEIKGISSLGIKERWFTKTEINSKNFCYKVNTAFLLFCGVKHLLYIGRNERETSFSKYPVICAETVEDLKLKFIKLTKEEIGPRDGGYFNFHDQSDRDAWLKTPCHDIHTKLDCPVILVNKGSIVKCPNLKEIGVHTIKDPYTTFQDIGMYISGVMGQKQNPMVVVSDKSKVLKHGFDPKYGFRTRPKEK